MKTSHNVTQGSISRGHKFAVLLYWLFSFASLLSVHKEMTSPPYMEVSLSKDTLAPLGAEFASQQHSRRPVVISSDNHFLEFAMGSDLGPHCTNEFAALPATATEGANDKKATSWRCHKRMGKFC